MAHFVNIAREEKEVFAHAYHGIEAAALARAVRQTMNSAGYKLKEGSEISGVYERGNRVLRILLGAFIKYFKWNFKILPQANGQVIVEFSRATSGMSGGLIGMNQVKKEFKNINSLLQRI